MAAPLPIDADGRYAREQAFHDRRFGADEARAADGFYVVNTACNADYERVLSRVGPGSQVLEYGCGTGSWAYDLARRGAEVVGIDISPVAVAAATDGIPEGLSGVSFTVMNAEALEFPDGSFDLVCGSGILHHLDLDRALREVHRVLKPNGRAVFVEPLGHNPVINLYRRMTPGMRTEDEHPLLVADLTRLRESFSSVQARPYVLFPLLALPLRGSRAFDGVLTTLNRVDAAVFRRFPAIARHAWTVVIEVAGPRQRVDVAA